MTKPKGECRQVYTKWFWNDWKGDSGVQASSLAARGLWHEMLGIMFRSEGYLRINGRALTDAQLARMVGADVEEVTTLIAELEANRVFSRERSRAATIYSRRIRRDHEKRAKAVANGKLGGNPTLRKPKEISEPVNPSVNPHSPESTVQDPKKVKTEKEDARAPRAAAPPKVADGWPSDAFERFWHVFPNKVDKRGCEKKFALTRRRLVADGVTWELFLAGLQRYVNKTDDRPWLMPATFLHQDRYNEKLAPAPGRARTVLPFPGDQSNGGGKVTAADLAMGNYKRG